jgi:hypothetical protein
MDNANSNGDRNMTKTQTIAGHRFTLEKDQTYIALRPMALYKGQRFIVTIQQHDTAMNILDAHIADTEIQGFAAKTKPLSYDDANALINAFNDGGTSWDGRIW